MHTGGKKPEVEAVKLAAESTNGSGRFKLSLVSLVKFLSVILIDTFVLEKVLEK